MCDPLTIGLMFAAGTAATVVGQVQQGRQQKEMDQLQADQTLKQGAYANDAALQTAKIIRKSGQFAQGSANADLAASGVKIDEGTPLEIQKTIKQNSEQDALTVILNGGRTLTSAQQEAQLLGQAGGNAVTNSYWNAGSTVLGAGARYATAGFSRVNSR